MGRDWRKWLRGDPPSLSECEEEFTDIGFAILHLLDTKDNVEFTFNLKLCSSLNSLVAGYIIEDKYKFEDDILKPKLTSRGKYFIKAGYMPDEIKMPEIVLENLREVDEA